MSKKIEKAVDALLNEWEVSVSSLPAPKNEDPAHKVLRFWKFRRDRGVDAWEPWKQTFDTESGALFDFKDYLKAEGWKAKREQGIGPRDSRTIYTHPDSSYRIELHADRWGGDAWVMKV